MTRLPAGNTLTRPDSPEALFPFLSASAGLHLYELGDLEEPFFSRTRWWASQNQEGELEAVVLEYAAPYEPVILAMAAPEEAEVYAELIGAIAPELPDAFYTHATEPARRALGEHFTLSPREPHLRMVLTGRELVEEMAREGADDAFEEVTLGEQDVARLLLFYEKSYPENAFDARMLSLKDAYTGIERDGVLLAVAGVHVLAPSIGVASLGNITVNPSFRGQGLGKRVTASICRKIADRAHRIIGLNVHADNTIARRTYASLGFATATAFDEFRCTRQTP